MILNDFKNEKDLKFNTSSYVEFAIIEKNLFFFDYFFNGLFRMNLQSGKTEFVDYLPDELIWQEGLYGLTVESEEIVLFLPISGKNIYKFYCIDNSLECVNNPYYDLNSIYNNLVRRNDEFIIVPNRLRNPTIVYSEGRLYPFDSLNKCIFKVLGKNNDCFVEAYGVCSDKQSIYIAVLCKDIILKYDIYDCNIGIIEVDNARFGSITLLDNFLWAVSLPDSYNKCGDVKCSVIRYDLLTWHTKWYELPQIASDHSCYCFTTYKDTLLAFEHEGDHIWIYDKASDKWDVFASESDYPTGFRRVREGYPLFFGFHHTDEKLLLPPTGGNGTIEIDEKTDKMTFYPSILPEEFMETRMQIERERRIYLVKNILCGSKEKIISETEDADIDAYIGYML